MKILHLTLNKGWFDMIPSGEKKEEYREIKETIVSLLYDWNICGHTRKSFTEELLINGNESILRMYLKPFSAKKKIKKVFYLNLN